MSKAQGSTLTTAKQTKDTTRYHFTSTKMATEKEKGDKAEGKERKGEKEEERVLVRMWRNWDSQTAGGNIKWCSCVENSLAAPQKAKHRITI
jgi:site-specific DNA-cytosine methylase